MHAHPRTPVCIEWQNLNCTDKGLMLEMSALKLLMVIKLRYHYSVDNTKLHCYTLPLTQHHSFYRHLPFMAEFDKILRVQCGNSSMQSECSKNNLCVHLPYSADWP